MRKKIALEEHFMCPGFEDYWKPTVGDVDPAIYGKLTGRLYDFGGSRIEAMDAAGIERAVLSLAGPGVQVEPEPRKAVTRAKEANDLLAREIAERPGRYSGFAHLPMQDPVAAADELERCMGELGFCGAMINGHTNGRYLDHASIDPFWERAEALDALVYLHPADPAAPFAVLDGRREMKRAMWEWTLETGSHALRLVFGGVFDRFPRVRLALGHLGETLPFLLWRFDSRAGLYGLKLKRKPSAYIRQNMVVTMSGMFSREPLVCAVEALGRDRVMFSADYPFESAQEAADFIDNADLPDDLLDDLCFNNAAKALKL